MRRVSGRMLTKGSSLERYFLRNSLPKCTLWCKIEAGRSRRPVLKTARRKLSSSVFFLAELSCFQKTGRKQTNISPPPPLPPKMLNSLWGEPWVRPGDKGKCIKNNINEYKIMERCQATVRGALAPASLGFAEMTSYISSILPACVWNGCSELCWYTS